MRITSAVVRVPLTLAFFFLPAIGGCDCASTPVEACSTSADCEEGFTCIDRICVPRSDAGQRDGGGDGVDGGPACVDVDRDGHFAVDAIIYATEEIKKRR